MDNGKQDAHMAPRKEIKIFQTTSKIHHLKLKSTKMKMKKKLLILQNMQKRKKSK